MSLVKIVQGSIIYFGGMRVIKELWTAKVKNYGDYFEKPSFNISIVIPVFNEEQYIGSSLMSLYGQNLVNAFPDIFEFIIVDNGSTDNTVNTVMSISRNKNVDITVLDEPRRGPMFAKDSGIRVAKGDIIVCANADVYYYPNWVNLLLKPFKDKGVVGTTGITIYSGIGYFTPPIELFRDMPYMMGNNSAFLRSAYLKSPFDTSVDQSTSKSDAIEEELKFAQRLSQYGKVIRVWDAVAVSSVRKTFKFVDKKYKKEIESGQRMGELVKEVV